jgi:hypothetical protein
MLSEEDAEWLDMVGLADAAVVMMCPENVATREDAGRG